MIPLTAVEELALPVEELPTERDQPDVLVPITFVPSLVSNVSKSLFKMSSSFFELEEEDEEDEDEDEDEDASLSLQAASAVNEENIIIDKQSARSCFLRFLE